MPIFALASLLVFAWSFTVPRDAPRQAAGGDGRLGAVGAVFREAPRFWGFLAALFLVWTGFNAAWNFISLKIVSEGGGPLLVGIGTAAGGLIEVPMMRSSSRLQSRYGLRKVYALGCSVYALGFLLWGSISNPTIVSLLTILEGVAFSLLFTTGVVVVGRLLPSSLYSTGNSVAQMVGFGLGPILGAGIGGYVYQHLGIGRALRGGVDAGARRRGRGVVRAEDPRARSPARAGRRSPGRCRRPRPWNPWDEPMTANDPSRAEDDRTLVARAFPQLALETFEAVGAGWTSATYLVDGEWIVQVPTGDRAEERLLRQIEILPELAHDVSGAVPVPELVSRDPVAMGYRRIEGAPYTEVGEEGMWPERLGRFLYDLHLVPPEFVGMRAVAPERHPRGTTDRVRPAPLERSSRCSVRASARRSERAWTPTSTTTPTGGSRRA